MVEYANGTKLLLRLVELQSATGLSAETEPSTPRTRLRTSKHVEVATTDIEHRFPEGFGVSVFTIGFRPVLGPTQLPPWSTSCGVKVVLISRIKGVLLLRLNTPSWHISGILVMGVRLTSHWTAAAFMGLLSVPG
jgi:hypothetical protein